MRWGEREKKETQHHLLSLSLSFFSSQHVEEFIWLLVDSWTCFHSLGYKKLRKSPAPVKRCCEEEEETQKIILSLSLTHTQRGKQTECVPAVVAVAAAVDVLLLLPLFARQVFVQIKQTIRAWDVEPVYKEKIVYQTNEPAVTSRIQVCTGKEEEEEGEEKGKNILHIYALTCSAFVTLSLSLLLL